MSRKIVGITVGTPIKPQTLVEKTEQAKQIDDLIKQVNELEIPTDYAKEDHTHDEYVSSMNVDGTTLTYNKGDGTTETVDLPKGVTSWNDLEGKPFGDTAIVYKNNSMEMRKFISEDGSEYIYVFDGEYFELEVGKTYIVIIDGVEYTSICTTDGYKNSIGDFATQGFRIIEYLSDRVHTTITTQELATSIEIIKNEVQQIDVKYIPEATTSTKGAMSAEDKVKLDGIEQGANNYTHPTYRVLTETPIDGEFKPLSFGGTFDVVDTIVEENGHITEIGTERFKLPTIPSEYITESELTTKGYQTVASADSKYQPKGNYASIQIITWEAED